LNEHLILKTGQNLQNSLAQSFDCCYAGMIGGRSRAIMVKSNKFISVHAYCGRSRDQSRDDFKTLLAQLERNEQNKTARID
jgi:hypothetical protein